MTAPALRVTDLTFAYTDAIDVLRDVRLTVRPGERVGVIGPNGAGKTTFFLLLSGVLKPRSGTIELFDTPVVPGQFRPEIGLVFQNPDDQLISPTVREDVAFGPRNLGLTDAEVESRVDEALKVTDIQDLAERVPHHLSGGEKRMAAIAGVLAMRPSLVLYDEPNAHLDIRARRRLIEFLQQSDHTFLLASHDLELILDVCQRVVLFDAGSVVASGAPYELMGDVDLMEAHGLERPHSLVPHVHFPES